MESTLALANDDLVVEVAAYLGWGRTSSAWDADQLATLASLVRSGLRAFYFPPPIPPMTQGWEWSFLRPTVMITLLSGAESTVFPDDFGGLDGDLAFSGTDSALPVEMPDTGAGSIYQKRALYPTTTGRPQMSAIVPKKKTTDVRGQRFELIYWPKPDRDYHIILPYFIVPDALTAAHPYHYGGAAHAETILESCLAQAELKLDDARAIHQQAFLERLAASIAVDRRFKPANLGQNVDRSDMISWSRYDQHGLSGVTVYGATP